MKTDLVYVVEDDSIAAYVIKLELEAHQHFTENKIFKNGKEAYDELSHHIKYNEELPDLILLDLNMPIMDGWEFLEVFSELKYEKQISVIILTSSINPEDAERAKSYKVVKDFLSKPLTMDKLDSILKEN